jgi:uncharacterized cupin superfamily protein
VVREATLVRKEAGLVPEGDGWFVLNAREALWEENREYGRSTTFEGETRFPGLGINLNVLAPGQPLCMYHGEDEQEGFLILAGEALLLIEGEERPLRQWDFVHCPRWAQHVIVGAGSGPCVLVAVGTRTDGDVLYPVAEVALKHGAGVRKETHEPKEAYAEISKPVAVPYREGDLPDW